VLVAPAAKRKYRRKSEQGDDTSSSAETEMIVCSLPLEVQRGIKKDFSHHEGEPLTTWLVQCWGNRTDSFDLEDREAIQLGSFVTDGCIDKVIGGRAENQSLWRRILWAVRSRYPYNSDIICRLSKRTTMEKGIKYLRELAV